VDSGVILRAEGAKENAVAAPGNPSEPSPRRRGDLAVVAPR
jgi:hypothetical protein